MAELSPDPEAALAFLDLLRPGGPWVLTAITPDGPATTETFYKADVAASWIGRENGSRNVYLMVAEPTGTLRKKATKGDVARTRHLWADIDGSGDLRGRLNGHVPPPSVIVESGGGLNVYWALGSPIEDVAEIEARNRWLSENLAADHCWNCDRILRLPGTINWPNAKKKRQGRVPVLARCVEHHPDRIYGTDAFGRIEEAEAKQGERVDLGDDVQLLTLDDLPAEVRKKLPASARRLIKDGPGADEYGGDRSKAVHAVTCALVRAGASDDQIAGILLNPALPIHDHVRDQTGHGPRAYVMRQIERARGHVEGEGASDDAWIAALEARVADLNKAYFVAGLGASVRVVRTVHDENLQRERLVVMRDADIKLRWSHEHVKTGVTTRGNDIMKGLGEAWLSHPQRRTYDRIELIPSGKCPPDVYNLWRGFGVEPGRCEWSTIEAHLWEVICSRNEEHYRWLLGWLAYVVQHPGRHAETAVVMRGLKGTGKGLVAQMLFRIFNGHGLHISHSKHLIGNFNAHLVDALFLFLDEALWAGDKQGEGVLKRVITERTLVIEPKGVDSFEVPNRLKILISSNNDWVVPVSADERRFFVLDVPDTRKGDKAYFTALVAAIEGDELAGFLDYLLKLDLTDFDHRNPPHTAALNRQKLIGADSLTQFWFDCLNHGEIVGTDISEWPVDIVVQVIHAAYCEFAATHGDRYPMTDARMAKRLGELLPDRLPMRIIRPRSAPFGNMKRPNRYVLPALAKAREAFLTAMQMDADYCWPDVEAEQ